MKIGRGNTAEVFTYGDKKVYKLFGEGYKQDAIKREYTNALIMEKLGLSVPRCYGMITETKQTGIIYERIQGKTMLECLFEGKESGELIEKLVVVHKQILTYHTQEVRSYKDFLTHLIQGKEEENKELMKAILQLPDGDYVCHGDYHPGNLMIGEEGKVYIIDFMNVCRGPWRYDVARTYFLMSHGEIPHGIPQREEILTAQRQLADFYLNKMDVLYEEIVDYLEVIKKCRYYE